MIVTDLKNIKDLLIKNNIENTLIITQESSIEFAYENIKFQMKNFSKIFENPIKYFLVIRRDHIIDSLNFISK